jgi:hypothetical protein
LNPQPISDAIPRTKVVAQDAQNVINITDDPNPNASTFSNVITEQAPLPPQSPSPPQETIVPSQPTSLELMQLYILDPSENVKEPITLTTETLSQLATMSVPILVTLPLAKSLQQQIPSLTP